RPHNQKDLAHCVPTRRCRKRLPVRIHATAAHRSVRFPERLRDVVWPFASITATRRPTLVKLNGPGGVSVGALNPIAPPLITTVVVPSDEVVTRSKPAGSWTVVDAPVSRFVTFQVEGAAVPIWRTTLPDWSKNTKFCPASPATRSIETGNAHPTPGPSAPGPVGVLGVRVGD